jgi:hypothetical protein
MDSRNLLPSANRLAAPGPASPLVAFKQALN